MGVSSHDNSSPTYTSGGRCEVSGGRGEGEGSLSTTDYLKCISITAMLIFWVLTLYLYNAFNQISR